MVKFWVHAKYNTAQRDHLFSTELAKYVKVYTHCKNVLTFTIDVINMFLYCVGLINLK